MSQFILMFEAYYTGGGFIAHAANWATGLFPMDFVGELVLFKAGLGSTARNQPEKLG